jgi:hypothetical protein
MKMYLYIDDNKPLKPVQVRSLNGGKTLVISNKAGSNEIVITPLEHHFETYCMSITGYVFKEGGLFSLETLHLYPYNRVKK